MESEFFVLSHRGNLSSGRQPDPTRNSIDHSDPQGSKISAVQQEMLMSISEPIRPVKQLHMTAVHRPQGFHG